MRHRGPSSASRLLAVLSSMAAALLAAATSAFPGEPTLYETLASSQLVVHGRCQSANRRAVIEVLEVFKGNWTEPALQVTFRSDNLNRDPGTQKIEFTPGAEAILVLEPELDSRDRPEGKDRFQLRGGARGKIDLPAEGAEALLIAARRLSAIQKMSDQEQVWEAQKALLSEANPYLVRVGFEEVLRFHLGDEELVMPVLKHLDGPRPEFRRLALQVIAQYFQRQVRTGSEIPSSDLLVKETLARAGGDDVPGIRKEAVRTLHELRRQDLAESFRQIASKDPSQEVRYEAHVALKELQTGDR